MKFLTRYNHAKPVEGDFGVSATSQQYKSECDINDMMSRFKCGQPVPVKSTGIYGDFTGYGDYMDCLNRITKAREDFAKLPSHIRERFGHDPNSFVEFCLNPQNVNECVKLGLREEVVPTASDRVLKSLETIADAVTRKGEGVPADASVQEKNT